MSLKGLAQKVVFRSRQGDSQKYTGGSPSPSFRQKPRSFGDYNEDDPEVCLNCDLPPERCHGTGECYLKHKETRDNADSH